MILDFSDELTALRNAAAAETVENVLSDTASPELLGTLDQLLLAHSESGSPLLWRSMFPAVSECFGVSGDPWLRLQSYCARHFPTVEPRPLAPYLIEVLLVVFRPAGCGVWIDDDALSSQEPDLEFDKEGLLVGSDSLEYTKEGVLTDRHWLFYDGLPGVGRADGFAHTLLKVADSIGELHTIVRVALQREFVASRVHHQDHFAKARIRGPVGFSEERLQDPTFPSDPAGTVITHAYADRNCMANILFPVDRIEVEWSIPRPNTKQVEIEELKPYDPNALASPIYNRYVHAEWDVSARRFTHFDGAFRSYDSELYEERLGSDLKKFDGRRADYHKCFKFNAHLGLLEWSDLTARYFEHNELVLEYLGGPAAD